MSRERTMWALGRLLLSALLVGWAGCGGGAYDRGPGSAPPQRVEPRQVEPTPNEPVDPASGAERDPKVAGEADPGSLGFATRGSGEAVDDRTAVLPWAEAATAALRERLALPADLVAEGGPRLEAVLMVEGVDAEGALTAYGIRRRSGDPRFDAAVHAAVRAFMPAHGGEARLPAPSARIRDIIASRTVLLSLESRPKTP